MDRCIFLFAAISLALCFGMGSGSNVENNSEAVMELLLVIITDEIGSYPPALLCLALSLSLSY